MIVKKVVDINVGLGNGGQQQHQVESREAELTGGDVKCEQASSHLGSDVRPRPTLLGIQPTQGGRRLQVQPSPIQPFLSATCNDSRIKAGPKSILKKPLY